MMKHLFLFFLLLTSFLEAKEDYRRPPHVSEAVWNAAKPYFLPAVHPLKTRLDNLFATRVTQDIRTLHKAGFKDPHRGHYSRMIVARHNLLKGYLVKLYADVERGIVDHKLLIHRIRGARAIQKSIERHGYQKFFKVPKKWLYPLPANPAPSTLPIGCLRKNFILVVEDMDILPKKDNYIKWASSAMTQERARAMYQIIKENGLRDCIYPFNLPFCKDGKQAFIDTEHHHHPPVHFDLTTRYFTGEMQRFWRSLTAQP